MCPTLITHATWIVRFGEDGTREFGDVEIPDWSSWSVSLITSLEPWLSERRHDLHRRPQTFSEPQRSATGTRPVQPNGARKRGAVRRLTRQTGPSSAARQSRLPKQDSAPTRSLERAVHWRWIASDFAGKISRLADRIASIWLISDYGRRPRSAIAQMETGAARLR